MQGVLAYKTQKTYILLLLWPVQEKWHVSTLILLRVLFARVTGAGPWNANDMGVTRMGFSQ